MFSFGWDDNMKENDYMLTMSVMFDFTEHDSPFCLYQTSFPEPTTFPAAWVAPAGGFGALSTLGTKAVPSRQWVRLRLIVFFSHDQHCMRTYLNEELVAEVRDELFEVRDGVFGLEEKGFLLLPFCVAGDTHPPCWIKNLHVYTRWLPNTPCVPGHWGGRVFNGGINRAPPNAGGREKGSVIL